MSLRLYHFPPSPPRHNARNLPAIKMPQPVLSASTTPNLEPPRTPTEQSLSPPKTPTSPFTPTRRHHLPSTSNSADTQGPSGSDVLLFLIASRLLNALIIQTFFQPDEYFQSLEPAWALAFGRDSGAWITWEWREHLRSALHPALFAGGYIIADNVANVLSLSAPYKAQVLLAAPKVIQAVVAAVGDYYAWRLAEQVYGLRSLSPAAALVLQVASPWGWFASTRTFSNGMEMVLSVIALYQWPWHWGAGVEGKDVEAFDEAGLRVRKSVGGNGGLSEVGRLRVSLVFAALATVLRPTNVLIWAVLVVLLVAQNFRSAAPNQSRGADSKQVFRRAGPSQTEWLVFIREGILCGSFVLGVSALADRLFYETWTFPPWHFLQINVLQSIAGFYGNNNWHYYLSEGYPLLLTTALPFALQGMYQSYFGDRYRNMSPTARFTLSCLTSISIILPAALSQISHKEVRFIYPLLPALHILAAHPVASFFASAFDSLRPYSRNTQLGKRILLTFLLLTNLSISLYTASIHNSGVVNVTHHLRSEFENHYLSSATNPSRQNMTVGFLMPCHSTPWRSHLQYPPKTTQAGIDAWALTCEPPLNMSPLDKANYLDEADNFYIDPEVWLKRHMSRKPPVPKFSTTGAAHEPGVFGAVKPRRVMEVETKVEESLWRTKAGRRPWPEYLVFFGQLEPQMKRLVGRASGYTECKREWNSHWHDDWRRRGEVVVWCLYPERADTVAGKGLAEQAEARKKAAEKALENVRGGVEGSVKVDETRLWKQRVLKTGERVGAGEGWVEWAKGRVRFGTKKKGWFDGWFAGERRGWN